MYNGADKGVRLGGRFPPHSQLSKELQQGALYKKIVDLLDEESVSGARSGRASL